MITRRSVVVGAAALWPTLGWTAGTPKVDDLVLRRSEDRGQADNDWLHARYSFSFSRYQDPDHMGFRALRVINEDYIAAGRGFPIHPHRDMEILTYVLSGALQHEDTLGNGAVIRPGIVQQMSAGTGIQHSETNPDRKADTHLLQIWLLPNRKGVAPRYQERPLPAEGALRLVASGDPAADAIHLHQDVNLYAAVLGKGHAVQHENRPGRHVWIQVAEGSVVLNGQRLIAGDGARTSQAGRLELRGDEPANVLIFDLA